MGSFAKAIELDKVRHIRFTLNSVSDFDDMSKRTISEVMQDIFQAGIDASKGKLDALKKIKYNDLRNVLWAALTDEDPGLTPRGVGDILQNMIDKDGTDAFTLIFTTIGEAYMSFTGMDKKIKNLMAEAGKEKKPTSASVNSSEKSGDMPTES